MSNLADRIISLKVCIAAATILCAMVYAPHQDEADDKEIRAQVEARSERPVGWIDLEAIADGMSALEISKTTRRMK